MYVGPADVGGVVEPPTDEPAVGAAARGEGDGWRGRHRSWWSNMVAAWGWKQRLMQAPPQGERAMEKRVGAGTWAGAEAGGREIRRMKMSFVERRTTRTL